MQARVEAAGADDHGVEAADRLRHRRMNRRPPARARCGGRVARASGRRRPRPRRASPSRRRTRRTPTRGSTLTGQTRPRQPSRARRPSTAARKSPLYCSIIDSSRLPPVWPPRRRVLERRQARQQHAPRLALVPRQRQRALEDVAGRQHAELVAELARAAAAVEHGDDRVQIWSQGLVFSPPSRLGSPVPPPKQPTFSSRSRIAGIVTCCTIG